MSAACVGGGWELGGKLKRKKNEDKGVKVPGDNLFLFYNIAL